MTRRPTLLCAQVEEALASNILNGKLPPGTQLPPEHSLIERFAERFVKRRSTWVARFFLIERTSYTQEQRPVDYEKLHYGGDQIQFVTRLARRTSARHKGER